MTVRRINIVAHTHYDVGYTDHPAVTETMQCRALDRALDNVDPTFRAALERAATQIRAFHERELTQSWFTTRADGTLLGVQVTPVAAAGIYVPGGRAQYPSTVLMNAIPAKVAGVERVSRMF